MQIMKLSKAFVVERKYPGLMDVRLTCEADKDKSTGEFQWYGPIITQEQWNEVLGFFRWTNKEHQSESQVRGYVNLEENIWRFWAFPQEEGTGMTAKELESGPEYDQAAEQRAQFGDKWTYFATVHHHCNGGAFQSGTDEKNESNTDGLHITIGKMGDAVHDMHARLYVYSIGLCLNPDMDEFWDIGIPAGMIPPDGREGVARWQMCQSVGDDQAFPEAWRANVIKRPKSWEVGGRYHLGFTTNGNANNANGSAGSPGVGSPVTTPSGLAAGESDCVIGVPRKQRVVEAADAIMDLCGITHMETEKVDNLITFIDLLATKESKSPAADNIREIVSRYQVSLKEISAQLDADQTELRYAYLNHGGVS